MDDQQKNKSSIILQIRKIPLGIKILLLIFSCLAVGFGGYVIYALKSETAALLNQHRQRSYLFSETIISGIRNIMLSGRAPYVRAFVEEAREEFDKVGEIRLFNNKSEEIFPAKNPHISIPVEDEDLKQTLIEKTYSDDYFPLKNEKSCQTCHADGESIRGTVKLDFKENADWEKGMLQIVDHAFKAIMLSGQGKFADVLLSEVNQLQGVDLVQVYDKEGDYVAFGNDDREVDADMLEYVIDEFHGSNDFWTPRSKDGIHFSPLPNMGSCQVCHLSSSKLQGILAMDVQKNKIRKEHVIQSAIIGLKNLMQLQRASYAGVYIDEIRKLSFVENFQVFDNGNMVEEGHRELWVPNPDYEVIIMDSTVSSLIAKNNDVKNPEIKENEYHENISEIQHLTYMVPIMNNEKCQSCHSPPAQGSALYASQIDKWKVRSIVKVSTSMEDIQNEIQKNKKASIVVGFIMFAMVAILMRVFMRITILKPLDIIGDVADKIGSGDLSVNANVKSLDEIGVLAKRINAMVKGLQERKHLTKFVSGEAVSAVKEAGIGGLELGGERKEVTIMETDIRGFTSLSEKKEPEEIVNLINRYLDKQTEVINLYGGDIDKFVGDAVLAVFIGEDMADSAVSCAKDIQLEMNRLNVKLDGDTMIGIGINTGPVVRGPIGSKDRMDYTVIGDTVNLACRLCDAADPGEIIISENTLKLLSKNKFKIINKDPVDLKGKEYPVINYAIE